MSRQRNWNENDFYLDKTDLYKSSCKFFRRKYTPKRLNHDSPYSKSKLINKNGSSLSINQVKHALKEPLQKINNSNNKSFESLKTLEILTPNAHKNLSNESKNQYNKRFSPRIKMFQKKISDKKQGFKTDLDLIEIKLKELEKTSILEAVSEYFQIFDQIIEKDYLFGKILKKIKQGLLEWKKFNDQSLDYIGTLEKNLAIKQSTINSMIIEKHHSITKNFASINDELHSSESNPNFHQYKFIPEEKIKFLNDQITNLLKINNGLEEKIKNFEEKEKKFSILISALKNRGYPIEEIYKTDVKWFDSESDTLENRRTYTINNTDYLKSPIPEPENFELSSSSSYSQ